MSEKVWISGKEPIKTDFEYFGLLGILNLTPDSFYDGGEFVSIESVIEHVDVLLKAGADIIDIGAESTRPGAYPITSDEEMERLLPVLYEIRKIYPSIYISIDTRNAITAARSLEVGVHIINDVSACNYDPQLLEVIIEFKPAYVLMHSGETPDRVQIGSHYNNIVEEEIMFFESNLNKLVRAGLPEDHIIIDLGIGFGKTFNHNLTLLSNLERFQEIGRPILSAISMKSIFGDILNLPIKDRAESTAIASALLWQKGAFWHRVHDVARTRNALILAHSLNKTSTSHPFKAN